MAFTPWTLTATTLTKEAFVKKNAKEASIAAEAIERNAKRGTFARQARRNHLNAQRVHFALTHHSGSSVNREVIARLARLPNQTVRQGTSAPLRLASLSVR